MKILLQLTLALLVSLGLAPMALAQEPARDLRVGVLYGGLTEAMPSRINAVTSGVRETFRSQGRRVEVLARAAGGDHARLPVLAREIGDAKVEALHVAGSSAR